jgi:hypothetical protein
VERHVAVLAAVLVLVAPFQGCLSGDVPFVGGDDASSNGGNDDGSDDGGDDGDDGDDGSDDPGPPPTLPNATFNGTNAYEWVEQQVRWDNGTTQFRVPGTRGAEEVRREIVAGLQQHNIDTQLQAWGGHYACNETRLVNVVGTIQGQTSREIILGAHYDSRPWAGHDPNVSKKSHNVPGANDGGSGVAALLELGRVLSEHRPLNYTVKLVFFDAEDGGIPDDSYARYETGCNPDENENHTTPGGWVIGSSHYVAEMNSDQRSRTDAVIILDMVGDENLTLRREGYSSLDADDAKADHRAIQNRVWNAAEALGYDEFVNETGTRILDDHRPFQRVGIPAVDMIHLDDNGSTPFPDVWHTTNDTLEHVSAESLEAAGRVTERAVYAMDRDLGRS